MKGISGLNQCFDNVVAIDLFDRFGSSYFCKPLLCPWYQWFGFFIVNLRLSCNFLLFHNAALSLVSFYFRIVVIRLCHNGQCISSFLIASKLLSHAFLLLHTYLVIHIWFSDLLFFLPLIDSPSGALSAFLFYIYSYTFMYNTFLSFVLCVHIATDPSCALDISVKLARMEQ